MSRTEAHQPEGGSRVAGYVLGTLFGAPLAFFIVAFFLRSPRLGFAVGLTAAILGLTVALRAWAEERRARSSG